MTKRQIFESAYMELMRRYEVYLTADDVRFTKDCENRYFYTEMEVAYNLYLSQQVSVQEHEIP